MFHEIDNNAAGFRAFFEDYEIDFKEFQPAKSAPRTADFTRMLSLTRTPLEEKFEFIIEEEDKNVNKHYVSLNHLKKRLTLEGIVFSDPDVNRLLKTKGYNPNNFRFRHDGERTRVWTHRSLGAVT